MIRVLLLVSLMLGFVAGAAHAQCGGEPATDSPCFPRMVPGTPGVYDIVMDVTGATPYAAPQCGTNVGHDVWFEVTPATDGTVTFSTCRPATGYDTVVQAWTYADCEFPVPIPGACSDDSTTVEDCVNDCSGLGSIVTIDVLGGISYLFQVGSFNANGAGCPLCLEARVTVTSNLCGEHPSDFVCAPRDVSGAVGVHKIVMDVTTATGDLAPICGFNVGHTVWFRVVPSISGSVTVSTCHPETTYDTVLQAYSGGDCEFLQAIPGACSDDVAAGLGCDNGCAGAGSMLNVPAAVGVPIWFQVGSYNNNSAGCDLCLGITVAVSSATGVGDEPPVSAAPILHLSKPNPTDRNTSIQFELPAASKVRLEVFDISGRLIRAGVDRDSYPAGRHTWVWDLRNERGNRVPPGVYFFRLRTPFGEELQKAVVLP